MTVDPATVAAVVGGFVGAGVTIGMLGLALRLFVKSAGG